MFMAFQTYLSLRQSLDSLASKVWSEKPTYHHAKPFPNNRNNVMLATFQEDGNVRFAERALTH